MSVAYIGSVLGFGSIGEGSIPSRHLMITFFGSIALLSALFVITESNSMNAVFFLVLSFVSAALIIIIKGIDYIGLLLIIVYVGAIAILFLFVVMMINIKQEDSNKTKYVPLGVVVALIFIFEVYSIFPVQSTPLQNNKYNLNGTESNIINLGNILYSWDIIIYSSLVLMVALIGAIILTLNHSEGVKRQDLFSKWTQ